MQPHNLNSAKAGSPYLLANSAEGSLLLVCDAVDGKIWALNLGELKPALLHML
jgi:hypothetical protein